MRHREFITLLGGGIGRAGNAVQTLVSRRITAHDGAAGAMASNFAEAFEKLQSQDTPVQRLSSGSASLDQGRSTSKRLLFKTGLQDPAALPAPTSALAEAGREAPQTTGSLRAVEDYSSRCARPKGQKATNAELGGIREAKLRRSQEALKAR